MTQYRRSDKGAWLFGYRYLDISLKPAGQTLNLIMSGPIVGYAFTF